VSSPVTQLATDLAGLFEKRGLRWKIGGENRIPTADDMQAVLDRAKYEVEYQAVNSHLKNTRPFVEMTHLRFHLNDVGKIEVLLKIGEIE
jgi:hypothetical protein